MVQDRGGKWWLPILQKEAQESKEDLRCMTKLTDHQPGATAAGEPVTKQKETPTVGLEPTTTRLRALRSTD